MLLPPLDGSSAQCVQPLLTADGNLLKWFPTS